MKTAINTQSQNEVKELLNEYVVFPLNVDISKTLNEMKKEMETFEETTGTRLDNVSSSVNGNINRLKSQLDASFHFDDGEDTFKSIIDEIKSSVDDSQESVIGEIKSSIDDNQKNVIREIKSSINNAINNSQEAIIGKMESAQNMITGNFSQIETVLTQLQSDLEAAKDQLNGEIKNSKNDFLSKASEHFTQLSGLLNILETVSKTSANDIKDELIKLNSLFYNKSETLTTLVTKSFEKSDKSVEEIRKSILAQIQKTEAQIGTKCNDLSEEINSFTQNISVDFEKQDTVLNNYYMETNAAIQTTESQQKELIERKYKTLFAISSSFGVANIIGIIVMIVLFLLK